MKARIVSEEDQREVTRLCALSGLMLLQHGAESALVESVVRRLGLALGADGVEIALMANALTVTTLVGGNCVTTVRRNEDRGINMQVVTEVQRVMLAAEAGEHALATVRARIEAISPQRYPRWLVVIMIGLSCAAFARLAKADLAGCGLTFVASSAAMAVRLWLASRHFGPLVGFGASAFVATSIALQGFIHHIGAQPKVAMVASVLLLVPGFPLINAVSDMVKGYINTGLSRWTMAWLLTLSTCGGIVLAMAAWNTWGWL